MIDEMKFNRVIMTLYLIGCIIITITIVITSGQRLAMSFASPLFLLTPILLEKIFRLKRNYFLNNLFYIFVFLAYCIGVTLGVYVTNSVYDKIIHFFSGFLFFAIGVYIFELLRKKNLKSIFQLPVHERVICMSFGFLFATATGPIWEAYEFVYAYLTGEDPQHVIDTGIVDTMQDMICCIVGALIMMGIYCFVFMNSKPKADHDRLIHRR